MKFVLPRLLLITGPQSARLLINDMHDTVPGKLIVTLDDLQFEEHTGVDELFDCFFPKGGTASKPADSLKEFFPNMTYAELIGKTNKPSRSFAYNFTSDISSVSVVMVGGEESRKSQAEQPKAGICILRKSGEQVTICPLPQTDRITQEEYAHSLVKLIQNISSEKIPNTGIACVCCGKLLKYPRDFCELCGTPVKIVKRISARDGVKRNVKISLMSGKKAEFTTDRGNRFSIYPKNAKLLDVFSSKMVLCVVTPNDARRLEIDVGGDGELQIYADKKYDKITSVKCKGKINVTRDDIADPDFPYLGDMALKPAGSFDKRDNVLMVDP